MSRNTGAFRNRLNQRAIRREAKPFAGFFALTLTGFFRPSLPAIGLAFGPAGLVVAIFQLKPLDEPLDQVKPEALNLQPVFRPMTIVNILQRLPFRLGFDP